MTKTEFIKQIGSIRNQMGQKAKQVQASGTSQQDFLMFISQIDNRLNLIMRELSIEIYKDEYEKKS